MVMSANCACAYQSSWIFIALFQRIKGGKYLMFSPERNIFIWGYLKHAQFLLWEIVSILIPHFLCMVKIYHLWSHPTSEFLLAKSAALFSVVAPLHNVWILRVSSLAFTAQCCCSLEILLIWSFCAFIIHTFSHYTHIILTLAVPHGSHTQLCNRILTYTMCQHCRLAATQKDLHSSSWCCQLMWKNCILTPDKQTSPSDILLTRPEVFYQMLEESVLGYSFGFINLCEDFDLFVPVSIVILTA